MLMKFKGQNAPLYVESNAVIAVLAGPEGPQPATMLMFLAGVQLMVMEPIDMVVARLEKLKSVNGAATDTTDLPDKRVGAGKGSDLAGGA